MAKESIEVTADASLGPQGLRVEHREMETPPRILGKNIDSVRRQYEQNLARISTNLTIARREIDLLGEPVRPDPRTRPLRLECIPPPIGPRTAALQPVLEPKPGMNRASGRSASRGRAPL